MRDPDRLRVLFDATRLATRRGAVPTGIDRVDLAYARGLAADPGVELRLVRFDALGPVSMPDAAARELLSAWRERTHRGVPQPAFERLQRWLEGPAGAAAPSAGGTPPRFGPRDAWRAARNAFDRPLDAVRLTTRLGEPGGRPWIYLNTSHGGSYRSVVSRWLRHSGVRSVFFVHDLIPIEYPEYNRPAEPARHDRRLATIAAHASQVLVNSAATRSSLLRHWSRQQRPAVPVEVLPLGVEQALPADAVPLQAKVPYFVVLSTIEPRKNHQLLLQLWQRLVQRLGDGAPRLVLVGHRGWQNEAVFRQLDALRGTSRHVSEIAGLDDAALARVLRGARALLSPSLAEGFSLPVAEALALGVPVLASDIAAHREVAGGWAELIDPLDGAGWLQAITEYAEPGTPRRERQVRQLSGYRPPRWDSHLARAVALLRDVARTPVAAEGIAPHA